ncbi:MAG: hypothetical protein JWM84_2190, partial [Nocardioides sp.]|nr:hypothetical protein [Nocardioides sp.]
MRTGSLAPGAERPAGLRGAAFGVGARVGMFLATAAGVGAPGAAGAGVTGAGEATGAVGSVMGARGVVGAAEPLRRAAELALPTALVSSSRALRAARAPIAVPMTTAPEATFLMRS